MNKELIELINKELTDFAHNREVGHLLRESVNTIERLELESVAATLLIENDGVLMTEMADQLDIQAGSIEVVQAANARLAAERDELRAELEALKQQEPVAWLLITSKDEQVCSVHKPKDDALKYWKPLYAAGASK